MDIQTANSSSSNSQPDTKCPSDDEQPCCSKDLRADGRVGTVQEREENTGMTEENRKNWEEKREREKTKKRSEGTEGEDGEKQEMDRSKEAERRKVMEVEQEEESEQEESNTENEEEEAGDEDFIRNSGLISHSYSLDLNLSPGA